MCRVSDAYIERILLCLTEAIQANNNIWTSNMERDNKVPTIGTAMYIFLSKTHPIFHESGHPDT